MRVAHVLIGALIPLLLTACPPTEGGEAHPDSEPGPTLSDREVRAEPGEKPASEPGSPAAEAPADEPDPGEAPLPGAAEPDRPGTPPEAPVEEAPGAIGGPQQILFEPAEPAAGQAVTVRAGPVTFRNGCEGVGRVEVQRTGERITIDWQPKEVPPDAFCTQALHDEWVTTTLEELGAGRYTVVVPRIGEATLNVGGK